MIPEFNPSSPTHLSILLFGGEIKEDAVEPVLVEGQPAIFQSGKNKGQLKTKKIQRLKSIKGLEVKPFYDWETKRKGIFSTDEKVLNKILIYSENKIAHEVCKSLLKIRELEKQIGTYYTGVEDLLYPDATIHPQFTHVSTDTGRLSCKNPNVQNQPTGYSEVKAHYISRFNNGILVQADYSQLELRVQAQLCGDVNYINDIVKGIDFHCKRLAAKEKRNYTEIVDLYKSGDKEISEARSIVKGFSFARAYGAGKAKIASQTGLSEDEVDLLIKNEEEMYPRLKLFDDWNKETVERQGWYKDPWGRRYAFKKFEAPFWMRKQSGITENYLPTQLKNYKIQGFATGVIVLIMLGKFWREKALHNRHKYLIVNTIHDSVLVDCKKDFEEDLKKDLTILEEVDILSSRVFKYKFKVPITIDIKAGKSWLEC